MLIEKKLLEAFEFTDVKNAKTEELKELLLMAITDFEGDENIINRLYPDQVAGKSAFEDANKIIWKINDKGNGQYELTTSQYWIAKEDVTKVEYEANITFFDEENES